MVFRKIFTSCRLLCSKNYKNRQKIARELNFKDIDLQLYICEDAVYNFINSIVEESKYCSEEMKKHFNKKLVMTKEDDEDFENSTKCQICDNAYVNGSSK